jgi:hypothetical protein
MSTEDLIAELARDAAPVRPLPSPGMRAIAWSAVALAAWATGIVVFGARDDLAASLEQSGFLWTAVIATAACVFAAMSALVLAIPGAERSRVLRTSTVALVGGWAAGMSIAVLRAGGGFAGASDWPVCFVRVLAIGLLPGIVLWRMLLRAAPLRPAWTMALAAIAATAAGAMTIQFVCPQTNPAHLLLGHVGPVLVMGWAGAASARRLLT